MDWQDRLEKTIERVDPGTLVANPLNYRQHPDDQRRALVGSLGELGWIDAVLVNRTTGRIIDGHLRVEEALRTKAATVPVIYVALSEEEERLALATFDPITAMATTDKAIFDALLREVQTSDAGLTAMLSEMAEAEGLYFGEGSGPQAVADVEPQIDRAEELRAKWGVETGQLWQLGEHRLICGDCTDPAVVARVMGGEKAALVHADPPYGMGKEGDGIANDNLYREKLDAFQMQWWRAARPYIEDNGSAYIWGSDEDLWRLWYCGGLRDSERLTFRNEVVWNKGHGQGMSSDAHRMYPTASERAIFFMLGEQGFNNNADNYWDGWEPVRSYLEGEAVRLGIGNAELLKICGVGSMYSHWFTRSQWIFIPGEHYRKLQAAFSGDGFKRDYDTLKRDYDTLKRDYDTLKRDFYATRAYFDNTQDNMTDVWDFPAVQGDDRHGHATPKPVQMVARAIKSSAPDGAVVLAPFNGTGPELIACETLGRRCRAVEISPGYVAVALQRWADATGKEPVLVEPKTPAGAGVSGGGEA